MNFLKIKDCAKPELASVVIASHLDFPANGTVLAKSGGHGSLLISGWVLVKDPECSVHVVLDQGGGEVVVVPMSIKRPDVIRRVLGTDSDSRLICGFRVQVEADKPIELSFRVDGQDRSWKQIGQEPVDVEWLSQVTRAWQKAISGDMPADSELRLLRSLNRSSMDLVLTQEIAACHDAKTLLRIGNFSEDHARCVEDFFKTLDAPDLPVRMVKAALEKARIDLVNPFTGRSGFCNKSWIADGKINSLLFVDEDEIFFVIQHVTTVDAVYFPKRNIAVFRRHLTMPDIRAVAHSFCRQLPQILSCSGAASKGFAGVLASHGRPYHFFYDVAPALQMLDESGLLSQIPEIFMMEGSDYFPLEKIYSFPGKKSVAAPDAINEEIFSRGKFLVHVGIQFGRNSLDFLQRMDARLLAGLPELMPAAFFTEAQEARRCFPLIWFGVTGQKRAWQEQAEAAVRLVDALRPMFPGIGLCVDGWTSPQGPTKRDEVESANDRGVLKSILARLPDDVPVFDLIGADCLRKLAFAQVIDLFVANHATGSIYVARFAEKPGIGHINNSMNCDGHIHPRTRRVPSESVTDVLSKERLRPDFVSYHIAPAEIVCLVSELLTGTDWLAERSRSAAWLDRAGRVFGTIEERAE